jgi:Fe-S oxidoreductase
MIADWIPGLVMLAGLAGALAGLVWRARRWLAGKAAATEGWRGLARMPRRYLVNVHEAVSRDPVGGGHAPDTGRHSAVLHILTAGGFTAASLLILAVHVLGWDPVWLAALLLAALASMAAGAVLVAVRRWPAWRAPRLSGGGFNHLPFGLIAFVVFFAAATLAETGVVGAIPWASPAGGLLLALGLYGSAGLYTGLTLGPLKHALTGALHLAFHPRPGRFEGTDHFTALQPMDLDAERLGAREPADFSWDRLLEFDACVECGRCEAACPAFEAGLPLSPKKLIQDLVAAQAKGGSDAGYRGRPYPGRDFGEARGGPDQPLVGSDAMIDPDTLWACTTCQACVYECPMMIGHVDAVVDLRRYQALEQGAVPGKGAEALEELRATDTLSGRATDNRLDWAADLAVPVLAERGSCDVLLWTGEGSFEMRNQQTLRALVRLLRLAGVDFAVLGREELDCGHVARVLGEEAAFRSLKERNLATLAQYRFDRIVTADPHVLHTLTNDYDGLGERVAIDHHSTFLAELLADGRLRLGHGADGATVTFHDPCYLARGAGETRSPRDLLEAMGMEVREMTKSGMRTSCCGWGGGGAFTDVPGERRIPDVRMDHARATGADTVAVACPNCAVMLEGVVDPGPEVRDLAEVLLESVASATEETLP